MTDLDDLKAQVLDGLAVPELAPLGPDRLARSRVDWSEFWTVDRNESDWLCEPLLPASRGIATYAQAKRGKSLLSLDVAARLATGTRCLDQAAGPARSVLYIDLEMTGDDLHERLEDMGHGPASDLTRLHYYLLPDLAPLDTAAGGEELTALAAHHQADLVVIDTTSRVLAGPENDADTVRAYWRHTGSRLKADGRTVWRLDHAGKDLSLGQRGTSAKADDVDVVWELTPRDDGIRLRATHRRLGWVPETVDLVRLEDPLRHERAATSWPAGTAEVAKLLDGLDAPLDLGGRRARLLLRESGHQARNETIAAALRWRRQEGEK